MLGSSPNVPVVGLSTVAYGTNVANLSSVFADCYQSLHIYFCYNDMLLYLSIKLTIGIAETMLCSMVTS